MVFFQHTNAFQTNEYDYANTLIAHQRPAIFIQDFYAHLLSF